MEIEVFEPMPRHRPHKDSKLVRILNQDITSCKDGRTKYGTAIITLHAGAAEMLGLTNNLKVAIYRMPARGYYVISTVLEPIAHKPFKVHFNEHGCAKFSSSSFFGHLSDGLYDLEYIGVSSLTGRAAYKFVRHE